jgi:hypothetical protein
MLIIHEVLLSYGPAESISRSYDPTFPEFLIDLCIDLDVIYIREQEIKWEGSEVIEIRYLYRHSFTQCRVCCVDHRPTESSDISTRYTEELADKRSEGSDISSRRYAELYGKKRR